MTRSLQPVTTTRALAAILAALATAACGNLTAGGFGEVAVDVSGDAPESSPTYQASVVSADGPAEQDPDPLAPLLTDHDDELEGELEAEFSVFLVADDGELVPLTDGDVRVDVDLAGVREPEIATRLVAAGRYTGLRMVFREIDVEVDAGLVIDGMMVTGLIDIEIDEPLEITKTLDLDVRESERARVLIDLNAGSWLEDVDPLTKTVDPQEFAADLTVTIR